MSTRATLCGAEFLFLNNVVAPAELPTSVSAYKSQQARWAKGSTQCLQKYGRSILTDHKHSLLGRLYALFSMSAYATHLLLIVMLLLLIPLIYIDYTFSANMLLFSFAGVGQPLLFILGQQTLYPDWQRRLRYLPTLLLLAIGTAPSNSRAIFEAIFDINYTFIRTPKFGSDHLASSTPSQHSSYQVPFDWIIWGELFLALYAGIGIALAFTHRNYGPIFFLLTCLIGFSYVAFLSIRDSHLVLPNRINRHVRQSQS